MAAAPEVVLSTHMDTVPPFFPSSEDEEFIWGRGACDTKGIIAEVRVLNGRAVLADLTLDGKPFREILKERVGVAKP